MKTIRYAAGSVLLISALLAGTGCAERRHGYYDPYYHDRHRWGVDEDRYYHEWYVRTYPSREYREYRRLDKSDQERYWRERHAHDHDHDHDRH